MKRALRMTLCLLVALIACATKEVTPTPTARDIRTGIVKRDVAFAFDTIPLLRFPIPYPYGAIRLQVEGCSGLTRDGWPRFYVAALNPLPGHILAFYREDMNAIVFALGNEVVPETIAHELLHYLLAPHIRSQPYPREAPEAYRARVHPDSIYAASGKCGHLLSNPGR